MRYHNKKGFFLIETIAACALLVAISGIISMYIAAMGSHHRKAKEQLHLFRLAQQAINGNNAATHSMRIESEPFIASNTDLQTKGYSTRFHDKLIVKRVSVGRGTNEVHTQLTAICLKDATV